MGTYGKVTIQFKNGTSRRGVVTLNEDGSFNSLTYHGEVYGGPVDFENDHHYLVMVVSDKRIRTALERGGFFVKDSERVNVPLHLKLPNWEITLLDRLKQTEFVNHSRSDIINKILLDNLSATPPDIPYEKNMTKTTFTINPLVLKKLDERCASGMTRNHLIYNYVTTFLERYT